ncbi:zinc-ribbon domain-containing protein [Methanobacterium sp.]|uniref:zinc-ribbon domain-containing protein n=1 Tax=Methanobacterium sp. TaxID=2164 RepID=UPI003C7079EB
MFCPKCGTENKEDAKFCKKCGINLNDDSGITKENAGSPVKFLIVICIVLVAGLGIAAGYIFHGSGVASNSSGTYQQSVPSSNDSSSNNSSLDNSSSGNSSSLNSSSNKSVNKGNGKLYPCHWCRKTGRCFACDGEGIIFGDTLCAACNGTGKCPKCGGTKYHPLEQ